MEIRQLNTFITIARVGSFTQAAEILGYAQSSVTTQIQLLENEMEAKLFERMGRSITLTSEGMRLLSYAQKILKLSDEAKSAIGSSGAPKGALTVGAPESLCVMRLPGIFKEFHTGYPGVELTVKLEYGLEFIRMLRENIIDIAVMIRRSKQEDDLIVDLQFPEPMVLLAAPGHPLGTRKDIGPEDMEGQSLILTENGCTYRTAFTNMLSDAGVKPRSVLEAGSIQAIKQLTGDGLGISLLPQIAASDEVRQGALVSLDWTGPDFDMMTQVVYHKDKWISPAMRIFLDLLKKKLPDSL